MDGKDLMKAAVLAALVLVVGAYFVVASAQARSPVQQCFNARSAGVDERPQRRPNRDLIEASHWAYCISGR